VQHSSVRIRTPTKKTRDTAETVSLLLFPNYLLGLFTHPPLGFHRERRTQNLDHIACDAPDR
jgi:hypothetical protein